MPLKNNVALARNPVTRSLGMREQSYGGFVSGRGLVLSARSARRNHKQWPRDHCTAKEISKEPLHFGDYLVCWEVSRQQRKEKDSPEPPETVLELSRLEEQVTVVKIAITCCRIIAGT
jgi:hypothetical protein